MKIYDCALFSLSLSLFACSSPHKIDTSIIEYIPNNLGCPGDVHSNTTAAGGEVFVTGGQSEIIATFFNGSAGYNSSLYLHQPSEIFLGQQNHTLDGTQTSLGSFPKGQKLVFSLYVPEIDRTWFSGPEENNSDGIIHARIIQADTNLWYGGFEDLELGGDSDFDDVCFSIQGEISTEEASLPD
jgi:hypothetical protein